MNRTELIQAVSSESGVGSSDVSSVLSALNDVTSKALATGDSVKLPGFLTIERVERSARTARNPQTGEPLDIPAKFAVKITAGSGLKQAAATETP